MCSCLSLSVNICILQWYLTSGRDGRSFHLLSGSWLDYIPGRPEAGPHSLLVIRRPVGANSIS